MIGRTGSRMLSLAGRALRMGASFVDALFPAGCAICSAAVREGRPPLCGLCAGRVRPVPPPLCRRCGATRLLDIGDDERCLECTDWPNHLRAAAACLHQGVAAQLVHGLKYRGHTALAPCLAAWMVRPARRLAGARSPLLVPVPLARARLRERGFNQAELLARALASHAGWRAAHLLRRPAAGPSLAHRGRRDREVLARSAYALNEDVTEGSLRQSPILVVDDVITTGSTAAACTEVLNRAGATCLGAVCFTRTVVPLERS